MNTQPDLTLLEDPKKLEKYLIAQGFHKHGEFIQFHPLGGGVSNRIIKVVSPDRTFVVKQAQPKLAVQVEWLAPIDRILIEADSMEVLRPLLPSGTVPEIFYIDREQYLYIMECAPEESVLWKKSLLEGDVDLDIAASIGTILASMHSRTSGSGELRKQFWDNHILHALRIDPCFTFLAGVHNALADAIHYQANNLDQTKVCLVHGDYTPKNMLVSSNRLILLDYEIAHWGNPALDSGFLIAHLILKAIHHPEFLTAYLEAALIFWQAYAMDANFAEVDGLEMQTVRLIPFLVLARIDSKSPVEYLTSELQKEYARTFSSTFIESPVDKLEELFRYFFNMNQLQI